MCDLSIILFMTIFKSISFVRYLIWAPDINDHNIPPRQTTNTNYVAIAMYLEGLKLEPALTGKNQCSARVSC